ncbi:hypothetical protein GCK32_015416, partial [Trichostrongylus colubriformis]
IWFEFQRCCNNSFVGAYSSVPVYQYSKTISCCICYSTETISHYE